MSEPSIYARAIDVLNERGWTQGVYEDGQERVCTLGALRAACKRNHGANSGCSECARVSGELNYALLKVNVYTVDGWNDLPERTKEDVITFLKYADADELDTWRDLYGNPSLSDEA